jgi:hypothetical protein
LHSKMEFLAVVINVKQRWLRIPLKIKLLSVLIITKQSLSRILLKDQVPYGSDHCKREVVENSTERLSSMLL